MGKYKEEKKYGGGKKVHEKRRESDKLSGTI